MATSLHAQQDRQLVQNGSTPPSNGKRLALVIGQWRVHQRAASPESAERCARMAAT